jgi:hypothetical protein
MELRRDHTLLRMTAVDAGFDIGPRVDGGWLHFAAADNLASVWISEADSAFLVAVSPARLAAEVGPVYAVEPWIGDGPPTADVVWRCPSRVALSELLRRIAALGRVLPDQLLHTYNAEVEAEIERLLSASTLERTAEVRQRVGQDIYRKGLMQYWNGRCAISGVSIALFLRASHAKPWRDATDRERLDVHNGLLLAAHLDIAFDRGFITVTDDGDVLVSSRLPTRECQVLGLDVPRRIAGLRPEHAPYLAWHREHVWKR